MWLISGEMVEAHENQDRSRITSAAGAAGIHALIALLLFAGFGPSPVPASSDSLKIFEPSESPPPPPIEQEPPKAPKKTDGGQAAPPSLKAQASPIIVPPPEVKLPLPPVLAAAPVPGTGNALSLGSAEMEG